MRNFFMTTERIGFSTWSEHDRILAESLWGDPEVSRLICASGRFSSEEIVSRLTLEIRNEVDYGYQYWPIFTREAGELIGCCGLRPSKEGERCLELGVHLKKAFWQKGYAFEAASKVIAYAFRDLGADKLIAGHHPENKASAKLIKKLGFQYCQDNFYPPTGRMHPSYYLTKQKNYSD